MESKNYKNWIAVLDVKTCYSCRSRHGQIYETDEYVFEKPPLHLYCRCLIRPMKAKLAGTATNLKENGADWWLKNNGMLPDYYITLKDAERIGYKRNKGNLGAVVPGRMLLKGIYKNKDGHLPEEPDRIWFEADINYNSGKRNSQRILWSNDGLIFVTYDHYETFYEII